MERTDWVVVFLKGFAMGAADAVPGVSGGTIALITGIYDRLVGAIASIDVDGGEVLVREILQGYSRAHRRAAWKQAVSMDLPFLGVLAFGVLSAVVTAANLISIGVTRFPGLTYSFFFGLILASVFVLRGEVAVDSPRGMAVGVVGFVLAFVVSGSFDGSLGSGPILVFLSGAIAICAMILPGISGSLILLALGQYELMVGAVHDLTDAVFSLTTTDVLGPFTILLVFAFGALVGILSFARVVSWALETYREETLTFLIALMLGALRAPGEEILIATDHWSVSIILRLSGAMVVGGIMVVVLNSSTSGIEY